MDPEMVGEVIRQMREATNLPLIAQPHGGLPRDRGREKAFALTPDDLVRHLPSWLDSGVGIVGGCCGTTPAHLDAIVRSLRTL
jgi:5-methyltetrahydrofolate--homocysteine methyltransferase